MATRTKNGKWMGRVQVRGQRKSRTFPTKKLAEQWESVAKEQAQAAPGTLTPTTSFHSLLSEHLNVVKARRSEKHYEDVRLCYQRAIEHLGVDMPTYAAMETFLATVAGEISGSRANRFRTYLLTAWNWGWRAMGLPRDCPFDVEKFTEEKRPRYVPPEDDFWKVVNAVEGQAKRIVLFFLYTACRKMEAFNLKWSDIDTAEWRTVQLWTRKRKDGNLEPALVPLLPELKEVLQEQRYETGFMEYVFIHPDTKQPYDKDRASDIMPDLCDIVNKNAESDEDKIKPYGFHGIRHLSASILADKGVPLPTIQMILRHKHLTTTENYIKSLVGAAQVELTGVFTPQKKRATQSG